MKVLELSPERQKELAVVNSKVHEQDRSNSVAEILFQGSSAEAKPSWIQQREQAASFQLT
jgi:hypothetical protein